MQEITLGTLLPIVGKAGGKVLGELAEGAFSTKVVGTADEAMEKFKIIIGDAKTVPITNKKTGDIIGQTAELGDGTKVTYRTFGSEKDANAVIQLNNDALQKNGGRPVEIKFFDKEK